MIEFTIHGEPCAWKSHNHSKWGGGYASKKQKLYKELVGILAQDAVNEAEDATGEWQTVHAGKVGYPMKLTLKIYRSIPKSWSRKKRTQALSGELRPVTRPDNTNYQKIIEDGMTSILYHDDSQIVCNVTEKYYSDKPRVEVRIETL